MKTTLCLIFALTSIVSSAQDIIANPDARRPYVSFDDYVELINRVKPHRETHLVDYAQFREMMQDPNTIVLDTRSDSMFAAKHVKGAIHLNFSDFTLARLEEIIPSTTTRILIYCNNNFSDDQDNFPTKSAPPLRFVDMKDLTLALNIPTYINLFGYGYENVYELNSLIESFMNRDFFEGTAVQ